MCGHIGVAGNIGFKEEKILKQGLIVDSLRGDHSTGVAVVPKVGSPVIAKQVGGPFELLFDKRFDDALRTSNRVIIGHNRYATTGSVNKSNAHPFEFEHIYGAHNGTLNSWSSLDGWKEFSVDSQGLYHHMSRNGLEDTISKVTGAWALVWWDDKEQELNFLRNKERSFFYVMDKKKERLFWASEWEMLQLILNRNSVEYEKILSLAEDQWMRWPIDDKGVIGKPKTRKVEGKKTVYSHSTFTNGGQQQGQHGNNKVYSYDSVVLRKEVSLEVVADKMDSRRASYLLLKDAEHSDSQIRLYTKPGDNFKWKRGNIIVGDISSFTTDEGGYYKVSYSTVRSANSKEALAYDQKVIENAAKNSGIIATYPDHKGKLLTKAEWEKTYPYCSWCNIDLDADDENYLTKDGDSLCPHCSTDTEVAQYL